MNENDLSVDASLYQKTESGNNFLLSMGANIYNIFMKTGIAPECTPTQWKLFEKEMTTFIYQQLGMENPDPQLCNFTAFINSYIESLTLAGFGQEALKQLEELKKSQASK